MKEGRNSRRYLLYALGEIALVVAGILIALQIDSWNEARKERIRGAFALEQLTRGVQANLFTTRGLEDELRYQLALIDSLLYHPDSLDPNRIPGILQVLDEFAPRRNSDEAWYLSYLDIDPTDSVQFQLASMLRSFNSNQDYFDQGKEALGLVNVMKRHLSQSDIPRRVLGQGQSYRSFIDDSPAGMYSGRDLQAVATLIRSEALLGDLKTLREYRSNILTHIEVVERTNEQFLGYLQNNFQHLGRAFEPIQLVGSATPSQSWALGYPMRPLDARWEQWETELELGDGLVKFRAGNTWVFDWGRGEFDPKSLVFKGADIPVRAGTYHITININEGTYIFSPIE